MDDIEAHLEHLRAAADEEDTAAAGAAPRFVEIVAGVRLTT